MKESRDGFMLTGNLVTNTIITIGGLTHNSAVYFSLLKFMNEIRDSNTLELL